MPKMNMLEYSALREEINSRVQLISTLDNSVLVATGGLWLVVAAIDGSLLGSVNRSHLVLTVQLILLIVALLVILVTALKSWENINQITALSSYMVVDWLKKSVDLRSFFGKNEKCLK